MIEGRIEGRGLQGDRGSERAQSAVEGMSEHTHSDNHFAIIAIIAKINFFARNNDYCDKIALFFLEKTIIV
jgi:hypothetical protein